MYSLFAGELSETHVYMLYKLFAVKLHVTAAQYICNASCNRCVLLNCHSHLLSEQCMFVCMHLAPHAHAKKQLIINNMTCDCICCVHACASYLCLIMCHCLTRVAQISVTKQTRFVPIMHGCSTLIQNYTCVQPHVTHMTHMLSACSVACTEHA